ncbi:MAG: hypothetical protein ACYS47_01925 [Planctomycetota bacterium]|jgi:hypothetical protein
MGFTRTICPSLALLAFCLVARAEEPETRLPEGDKGIAKRYPGDKGIEKDPDVLFVERFDAKSLDELSERWENVKNRKIMSFSKDVPKGSVDGRSLLMTHVGGESTGAHLYRRLPPGHDLVFARFYVKFHKECGPIHHFGTHLGGYNPSTPWPQGGAGLRPKGDERFHVAVEPYGKNWHWDFYVYWQGMHVHGDGNYWGTPFVRDRNLRVNRGRWICVEMMVKLNDPPDASNGEQAFWIDGKLHRKEGQVVSHVGRGFPKGRWTGGWWTPDPEGEPFDGFQWRSVKEFKVNYLWTMLYITKAKKGHVSKVGFDNIVVAKKYIGPLRASEED